MLDALGEHRVVARFCYGSSWISIGLQLQMQRKRDKGWSGI
uniref:Uncharacterized protein n=1 Tax=Oryza barthii TaxID=65489 RepID=A0A0D3GT43_9ORYZ